jgi:hypothetical protein
LFDDAKADGRFLHRVRSGWRRKQFKHPLHGTIPRLERRFDWSWSEILRSTLDSEEEIIRPPRLPESQTPPNNRNI